MPNSRLAARARYRRGLMTSVVNNSSAFGFSVMITASYGMVGNFDPSPSPAEILQFALGAVLAISLIEAVASSGFRRRPHTHPEHVKLLGTAANLVSVAVALGVVYVTGKLLPDPAVWLVAPLTGAAVYVLVEAAELAVAENLEAHVFGEQNAESAD